MLSQKPQFAKVSDVTWEIPKSFKQGMRVPARIYATRKLLDAMDMQVYDQVTNVATLPGIVNHALCMPDGHSGYGFPIGGVAAFDPENNGVISPGGVGFDINCGMRLVTTNLTYDDVKPKLKELVELLFQRVPAGVGSSGFVKLNAQTFRKVIMEGAKWCIDNGYGWQEDMRRTEEDGCVKGADETKVSGRAVQRGLDQIGTLGSGNHYLEIQVVKPENIFDAEAAKAYGIFPNQVVVMFHCLPGDSKVLTEYGFTLPIRDLQKTWQQTSVPGLNPNDKTVIPVKIREFHEIPNKEEMFEIVTETGDKIKATEDHPIMTPDGLKFARELSIGNRVAMLPFQGVEYEAPNDSVIVDEEDIRAVDAEKAEAIIKSLKKKELLPLRLNSPKLPLLAKLMGFLTGDGYLQRNGARWFVRFIGKPGDLEEIRKDSLKLGYKFTKPFEYYSESEVQFEKSGKHSIKGHSYQISNGSHSLGILFAALGTPVGNKSKQAFLVPQWVVGAPKWIKRLYLAGYFGAEMTRPLIRKKEEYRFGNPLITLCKDEALRENAIAFLTQISGLVRQFDVECIGVKETNAIITKTGRSLKFVLKLSSKEPNLIKLWSGIGFEYCASRTALAALAIQYLKLKQNLLTEEAVITQKAAGSVAVTAYQFRHGNYPTVKEFFEYARMQPSSPAVWDKVKEIRRIESKDDFVYDLTVDSEHHNFVADGFITGNCGSRGFGHQVATDSLQVFLNVMERKYGIKILDRELACAPFNSPEGQDYFAAMKCGLNMSFANRQVILHRIRECFSKVMGQSAESMEMRQVYDVAHNTAKLEEYEIDGQRKKVLVHRKGATRAFGPGRPEVPQEFRSIGQPVIIGGSMETGSYLLAGTETAMKETWGSTAHGSGRTMSRTQAKHMFKGEELQKDMASRGILVRTVSYAGLAEEAGKAYKDIDEVIDCTHQAGISRKVVKLLPVANVKG